MATVDKALHSSARTGTGSDDWCTPAEVLDCVREVNFIAIDPCSNDASLVDAMFSYGPGCEATYIQNIDGLKEEWDPGSGLVYVNPPYSQMSKWADKIVSESHHEIVALVPLRTPRWWWKMWHRAEAVALWVGRLTFVGAESGAPFDSALFYYGPRPRRFEAAFKGRAEVIRL